MPAQPKYTDIQTFADKLTDRAKQQYGICLRGKPGWGENMAFFDTLVNTFGGRWFDMKWKPQLDTKPWHDALTFYVNLHAQGRPARCQQQRLQREPGAVRDRALRHVDRRDLGCRLHLRPKSTSQVADKTGFTAAPIAEVPNGSHWFWAWALAIPKSSKQQAAAKSFLQWATSKQYIDLVGKTDGWTVVPPGTRAIHLRQPRLPEGGAVRQGRRAGDQDRGL